MANRFASNKRALAECDVCGFQYKLKELRSLVVKNRVTNLKACPECWDADHPQNQLGLYPVADAQAVRDPRPDFAGYGQSRGHILPVMSSVGTGFVGTVSVSIA